MQPVRNCPSRIVRQKKRHMRYSTMQINDLQVFTCSICHQTSNRKSSILRHVKMHDKSKVANAKDNVLGIKNKVRSISKKASSAIKQQKIDCRAKTRDKFITKICSNIRHKTIPHKKYLRGQTKFACHRFLRMKQRTDSLINEALEQVHLAINAEITGKNDEKSKKRFPRAPKSKIPAETSNELKKDLKLRAYNGTLARKLIVNEDYKQYYTEKDDKQQTIKDVWEEIIFDILPDLQDEEPEMQLAEEMLREWDDSYVKSELSKSYFEIHDCPAVGCIWQAYSAEGILSHLNVAHQLY